MSTESTPCGTTAPAAVATITLFKSNKDTKGTRKPITSWLKLFTKFGEAKPPKNDDKGRQPGWCPVMFADDVRQKANVEKVYALVLDYDSGKTSPEEALAVWQGNLACAYTSWSHAPDHPRFRLIVVLSRPVSAQEYGRVWVAVWEKLTAAGQEIDRQCKDASRLWYLACRRDDHFRVLIQDGAALDVNAVLATLETDPVVVADGPIEAFEPFEANHAYGNAALRGECEAVALAAEGQRNSRLNKAAFSLGQLVASGALDASDATRALLDAATACGLGTEEAERTIRSGMSAGGQKPRVATHAITVENAVTADTPWQEPQPLTQGVELPPSPWATSLPPWLLQWVQCEAVATQTPEDLSALLALSVLATGCQRRFRVRIKDGWSEPMCIYVAIILSPGNRKSAVFRAATDPLYEWEVAQRLAIEAELATATTTLAIAEKKLRAAEGRAGKDGDITAVDDALAAAREFAAAQDELPVIPRLVTSDATQEAVARLLNEQDGCISVMDAEGCGPVALMLGRYSDGTAAVDVYLRGHAGDALRVDRVGRDPIIVDHPRVTMGITVQPAVIEQLSERRELRGLGLLARILWCQPQSTVGTRDVDPPPVPTEVAARYKHAIQVLLDRKPSADGELTEVTLSNEAWLVLRVYMQELEPRLAEDGDLAPIADWASKLAGVVARVAGLLHIATHAGNGTIPVAGDTMTAAVKIGHYLLAHAQKVLGQMGSGDPVVADAKAVLHFLHERKAKEISKRELHQALRKGHEGRFHRAEDLDAPLNLLAERGWVRFGERREGGSKGRVSVIVSVNPGGVGTPQKAQKPQKIEAHKPERTDSGPIEPIEAFEADRVSTGGRLIEVTCTMMGAASMLPTPTVTTGDLWAYQLAEFNAGQIADGLPPL